MFLLNNKNNYVSLDFICESNYFNFIYFLHLYLLLYFLSFINLVYIYKIIINFNFKVNSFYTFIKTKFNCIIILIYIIKFK